MNQEASPEQYKPDLSHLRFDPKRSRGRLISDPTENPADYYDNDVKSILETDLIRRLNAKTEIFPYGIEHDQDTRFSHTLTTDSTAQNISDHLKLNTSLARSIAVSHDVAQPAFAHFGETTINKYLPADQQFLHENAAGFLLQEAAGLNLTCETVEGIRYHGLSSGVLENDSIPEEYKVAAIADKISYSSGDFFDCFESLAHQNGRGLILPPDITPTNLAEQMSKSLGGYSSNRIEFSRKLQVGVIQSSLEAGHVVLSGQELQIITRLRDFAVKYIYPYVDLRRAEEVMDGLIHFLENNSDINPLFVVTVLNDEEVDDLYNLSRKSPKEVVPIIEKFLREMFNYQKIPKSGDNSWVDYRWPKE